MLDQITPIISTYNEAPNLARTLDQLAWAKDVVLVDSASTDETLAIARRYPKVRIFQTPDPTLAGKWNFALTGTGIATDWILELDADYVLTDGLIEELRLLAPPPDIVAYRVNFTYCIYGRPLRASIYPPDYKLLRLRGLSFVQDGHTQRTVFSGPVRALQGHILHDDRKSLSRWLWSQDRYQAAEARKLLGRRVAELDLSDRIRRRAAFGPLLVFLHILFVKGLIWEGRAGLYYAFQRMAAEVILALNLLDAELAPDDHKAGG